MHAFIPIVALLGLAAAQSDTTATGTSSSAAPNPTTECIAKCAAGDVNCQALCVNVPAPNASMIEATNECSRNECTQGDSGPEDTKKYGECLASCASDYYYVSGGTPTGVYTANTASTASAPANTNASATTGSGSSASSTGSSDSSESSATSTRSQAASSAASSASESAAAESTGAASALTLNKEVLGVSGGVVGLLVAALAL